MIPRRMTFQLTPLLDLLLIVIFAQYMEVQQNAEAGRTDLKLQQEELESRFADRETELEEQFNRLNGDLAAKREQYSLHYENILKQHQQAGSALADALNLPGSLMEQILRLQTDGRQEEAASLKAAVARMQNVLESREADMLQFILRYDEMRKHVTVWEIYIQDSGKALLADGEQTRLISYESTEEFVSGSFEASKAFTEPKPLVIILLSWGSPHAIQRQRATEGMSAFVERLRRDSGNTRWFDFSLMGYRLSGPVFAESAPVRPSETEAQ